MNPSCVWRETGFKRGNVRYHAGCGIVLERNLLNAYPFPDKCVCGNPVSCEKTVHRFVLDALSTVFTDDARKLLFESTKEAE